MPEIPQDVIVEMRERFLSYVHIDEQNHWRWTGTIQADGYGVFCCRGLGMRAHRAAWLLYRGAIPCGMGVLHHCDQRNCVNPDHLYLGTNADNARDAAVRNRTAKGERHLSRVHPECLKRGETHGMSKLTEEQVRDIRAYCAAGWPKSVVAKMHGIDPTNVAQIVLRKTWAHVTDDAVTTKPPISVQYLADEVLRLNGTIAKLLERIAELEGRRCETCGWWHRDYEDAATAAELCEYQGQCGIPANVADTSDTLGCDPSHGCPHWKKGDNAGE